MDVEKVLTRATLAAALLGLLIVVYAVAIDSIPATSKGYSEVYFEKPAEAPDVMEVGEKYVIPFVVSSNEKKATSYNYTVTFNGAEIARGRFTLTPKEKKTIIIELIPNSSSWKLSSNTSRRVVDRFTVGEVLIKEGKDGSIAAYPARFNQSKLSEKGLTMLSLNQEGLYSGEAQYAESFNSGGRSSMTSRMSINKAEIYMEHLSEKENYNFSWTNRIQLPDFATLKAPLGTSPDNISYESSPFLKVETSASPAVAINGSRVRVTMRVSALGGDFKMIAPLPLDIETLGNATVTYVSGPSPKSADIRMGNSQDFVWEYDVHSETYEGSVVFTGGVNISGSVPLSYNVTGNASSNTVKLVPPIVWLAVPKGNYSESKLQSGSIAYKNTSLDFKTGLPGDIYLLPVVGVEGEYIISYSNTNATFDRVEHVEKNATITVGKDAISVENLIEGETYALEKVKLSILLNSDAGKSYEIHLWSYVKD